jgi:UDP-glucuronate 4-epimerase
MNILVTGAAGFIGFHTVKKLLAEGHTIIGADIINDYYDQDLKRQRLLSLGITVTDTAQHFKSTLHENYHFYYIDLADAIAVEQLIRKHGITHICHLAAQAGVRYSLINPGTYIQNNINVFFNLINIAKEAGIANFVYASSSSIYGLNEKTPFSETDQTERPASLYAATKKANELIAHTYSHLFKLPTIGLRFFTVYGSWGRPDMAYFSFTKNITQGLPIQVYNKGQMSRDFTHISDICDGVIAAIKYKSPDKYYHIFNLGGKNPVPLLEFLKVLENKIGKKAIIEWQPMQPGDVTSTAADVALASQELGFYPKTNIEDGLEEFVKWYKLYHGIE